MSRNDVVLVWEFFKVSAVHKSKEQCKLCNALLSRGGKSSLTYNMSNLIKHPEFRPWKPSCWPQLIR